MSQKENGKDYQIKGHFIFFVTNNVNKFNEARKILAEHDISIGMLRAKSLEIQSEDLRNIAETSVIDAFQRTHVPIILEDAGLFVTALNGFPGPYASYVYKTVGNQGLLKLMSGIEDRRARFESAIAYFSQHMKNPLSFQGKIEGAIVENERTGPSGFGFDPVFQPAGSTKTFSEMNMIEKNQLSHRSKALRNFAEWYKK